MSFGDCVDDEALRAAWSKFCRELEAAGDIAFKDSIPASPLHRVDAFRLLTQNLGQAFDLSLETRNTKYPVIHAFCSPFCKLGGDNADFTYQQAWIDGESVYRIAGNRGTSRFFNIAVQGPRAPDREGYRALHDPFGDIPETNLFGHEMEIGWDGSFQVQIGGERPDPADCPNWLATTPGSRKLFIRNGFDHIGEIPAQIRIERIGMTEPRPMPTPAEMIAAMEWSGKFVTGLKTDWPDWSYEFSEDSDPDLLNAFPNYRRPLNNVVNNVATDRRRGRSVYVMYWKLQPDEALIIEWDANDIFWMMTNMNANIHSMDFLYRPVSYTPSRTKIDSDGKVRMVMAHQDPGFHNWIDTSGLDQGSIANRNMLTDHITEFRTRVVKHAELDRVMPTDSVRVTPEQRTALMLDRFRAISRRTML